MFFSTILLCFIYYFIMFLSTLSTLSAYVIRLFYPFSQNQPSTSHLLSQCHYFHRIIFSYSVVLAIVFSYFSILLVLLVYCGGELDWGQNGRN